MSNNVQQLLERISVKRQPVVYKNKTYIRPGYNHNPVTKQPVVLKPTSPLTPSPKYLQMEQEIEEAVHEEQEFDQWMNECFEQQKRTLLEDEYDFIRETSLDLSCLSNA